VVGLVVPGNLRAVRVPQVGQRVRAAVRAAVARSRWRASSVPQAAQLATNRGAVQPSPLSRRMAIRPLTAAHPCG
jgi:hypothetical protein